MWFSVGFGAPALKFHTGVDDPEAIEVMTALLEAKGRTQRSNVAGAYALPEIQSQQPDSVRTDLVMAEVDGLDLCRETFGLSKRSRLEPAAIS